MQIQSSLAAGAIAAAAASQSVSKERATALDATIQNLSPQGVETIGRTEQASADRDAQGGGEGLDHGLHRRHRKNDGASSQTTSTDTELNAISPEPPSKLDIVG